MPVSSGLKLRVQVYYLPMRRKSKRDYCDLPSSPTGTYGAALMYSMLMQ